MPNPPKPTALRLLQGNPGHRRLNDREPRPALGCKPPAWLPAAVLAVWKAEAPKLEALGLLTVLDEGAFAALCVLTVELHRAASADPPAVTSVLAISAELRALWRCFGQTPADRARVRTERPEPTSKLSRFLGPGKP